MNLFWTKHCDRLISQSIVNERGSHHLNQIFYCQRSDGLFFKTHCRKEGKCVKRVTQVVQHMITTTVNYAGFDDRVIQS